MKRNSSIEQLVHAARQGQMTRRSFMARAAALGVSGLGLLTSLQPAYAALSKKFSLKFGYTSTPTNPVSIGYERFAHLVTEKSGGDIAIATFCCNQLGNDQELVQSVQSGALQMGTAANNNLDQFTSKMMALELPYLISSRSAYRKFWQTSSGDIRSEFETKLGIKILMVMDAGGFRSIETPKRIVHRPSDLKGMKLRAAPTPIELATLKAWGADPIPLPYNQVFTALQQGTVDGEVLQPVWFYTDKHQEVAKNICDIHYIMLSHIGFINLQLFNSMPKDVQSVLLEAAHEAEDFEWGEAETAVNKAAVALKATPGLNWYEPPPQVLTEWRDQSRPVWNQFSERIGPDLIKRIEALGG
jgi:TRAP-type transport system periplasmic protein